MRSHKSPQRASLHRKALGRAGPWRVTAYSVYLLAASAAPAGAEETSSDGEDTAATWSAEVALTSDYVYRGISFSDGGPAAHVSGRWSNASSSWLPGLHADAWVSSVDFGPGDSTKAETSGTLGYEDVIGVLHVDGGIVYTAYLGAPAGAAYNYVEFYGTAGTAVAGGDLTAGLHYSPSYSGRTGTALFADLEGAWPLGLGLTATAAVGYASLHEAAGGDYTYWQLGLDAAVKTFTVSLRYHGNTESCLRVCGDRLALTIAKAF